MYKRQLQILASTPSFQRFVLWLRLASTDFIPAFGTSDTREYTVVSAFGSPGTRKYSVNSDLGTSGTREYSVSSAFRAPSTREYSVVSVLVLQLLKSILSHFRSSHSRYSRVLSHFSFW